MKDTPRRGADDIDQRQPTLERDERIVEMIGWLLSQDESFRSLFKTGEVRFSFGESADSVRPRLEKLTLKEQ